VNLAGRLLLVAVLLFAQAAGLAHQIWHDAAPVVAHADEVDGPGKAPQKSILCDFHSALGAVLGALAGGSHVAQAAAAADLAFFPADVPSARFSTLAPQSRAPPTLL